MTHQQIQLGHGVYMTDFRKGATIKGLSGILQGPKDVAIMLQEIQQLQSKILKLRESIDLIKEEPDWHKDAQYLECIRENFIVIIKYSKQEEGLIEKVLDTGYKSNEQKIEKLLDSKRVTDRRIIFEQEFAEFIKTYMFNAAPIPEQDKPKVPVQVENQDKDNQDDPGVYI